MTYKLQTRVSNSRGSLGIEPKTLTCNLHPYLPSASPSASMYVSSLRNCSLFHTCSLFPHHLCHPPYLSPAFHTLPFHTCPSSHLSAIITRYLCHHTCFLPTHLSLYLITCSLPSHLMPCYFTCPFQHTSPSCTLDMFPIALLSLLVKHAPPSHIYSNDA